MKMPGRQGVFVSLRERTESWKSGILVCGTDPSRSGFMAVEQTLELKVDNMSFLLEQLGRDCAPDQLIRELTVNAIQAVQATGEDGGLVLWDHEPTYSERFGAYKLAITDTGTGMTGPEMVQYINHLASSGRVQSETGNFGVGAKIAAATRNPLGMVYLSWKDGQGAMIWLWRNPETGQYGLRPLPRADGTHGYWAPLPEAAKPACLGPHGTVVVLLGEGEEDETVRPPEGSEDHAGLWLTRYLNTRFFAFAEGIEVRAREEWGTSASGTLKACPVHGMRHFLETVSQAAGEVELGDAVARWWILPGEGVPEEMAERYVASGHVGALFQGELYEMYTGRSGTAKLQSFGIAVGHHRVVLYLEPRLDGPCRVVANTARTALLMDGRPLPWGDWAEAFRERLPREILELMEEVAGTRDAYDRTRSFKERMKGLASLLFIGGGDDALLRLFAPERPGRLREPEPAGEPPPTPAEDAPLPHPPEGSAADAGSRPPRIDLERLLDLEVVWVPESECGAPDRAAHYIPETNTLLMNREFRVFVEYVERWRAKFAGNPAAQREVEELVREWLEQPLRELIIRSHFLRGRAGWQEESIRALLSDEALTAVSLPCYLTEMRLRSAVAQRLGRLRPERAAA
jgi:hypothetical protein